MQQLIRALSSFVVLLATVPAATHAHFRLLEPASWLVANDRGDPQKAAPCGGDLKDKGTPSGIVGKAVGGQKLHIKVQETIYQPGHYRVALAVNSRDELTPDRQQISLHNRFGVAWTHAHAHALERCRFKEAPRCRYTSSCPKTLCVAIQKPPSRMSPA